MKWVIQYKHYFVVRIDRNYPLFSSYVTEAIKFDEHWKAEHCAQCLHRLQRADKLSWREENENYTTSSLYESDKI